MDAGGIRRRRPPQEALRHRGIRVLGTIAKLPGIARRNSADTAVVAIPSASSELVNRVSDLCLDGELVVKVLPGVGQLLDGCPIGGVRDLRPEDLLGRHPVATDLKRSPGYLTGKRVLVTGAGGSIGAELCRQIVAVRARRADHARP